MTKKDRKLPPSERQLEDAARLKYFYLKKKNTLGLTQEKLASMLGDGTEGVTQGAVSHFLNGRTPLSVKAAAVFARALQISVSDFSPDLAKRIAEFSEASAGGEQDEADDKTIESIPMISAKAAAGLGHVNTHIETRNHWPFKRSWLDQNRLKPESLVLVTADGESMQPTIFSQDQILVDLSAKEPVSGQVFVLNNQSEGVIVKRLLKTALGSWIIISDNQDKDAFPDRYPAKDDWNDYKVVGRVVWRAGEL